MKHIGLAFIVLLIVACSSKKPGVEPDSNIWPYEFYEKFNLRTIVSSYSPYLRYYCASYPKDFFRKDQVYMPNSDKVVVYDLNRTLSFEVVNKDNIIVTDQVNDTYDAQHLYQIYYNEEHDDYRADLFYIPKRKDCVDFPLKEDENVSK